MLRAVALAGIAATPLMAPGPAQAATWQGVTGDYNTGSNWSANTVPTDTATFINNGTVTSLTISAAGSINLIEFAAGAPIYQITTGPNLAMSIQNITNSSGVAQRFTADNQSAFTVFGSVTGSVIFTAGPNDGSIEFYSGASASGSRFVGEGGNLTLRNFNGGTLELGSIEGSGLIRLDNGGPATLLVGGLNLDTSYEGIIQGALAITKVGTGTLTLTGDSSARTGATVVSGGTLTLTGKLGGSDTTINGSAGAAVIVSGADAEWSHTNIMRVGLGSLTVEDGASATSGLTLVGGDVIGEAGSVTVTGAGSRMVTGDILIGQHGSGSLTVADGGTVSSIVGYVGFDTSGGGTAIVTGAGSSWTMAGLGSELVIGNASAGVLTIADGGLVSAPITRLAFSSTATVNLDGTAAGRGVLQTGYVERGNGSGALNFDGGILRATGDEANFIRNALAVTIGAGGAFIDTQNFEVGITLGLSGTGGLTKLGTGTLTMTGANTYAGGTVVTGGILEVSGAGSITHASGTTALSGGQLSILSGADVTNFNGFIANVVGGTAEVLVDGAGSTWTNNGDLRVGFGGTGTLTVSDGGTLSSAGGFAIIGDASTAVGTMTVTGAGSSWTFSGTNMIVGDDGSGALTVSAGGTVTINGGSFAGTGMTGSGDGTLTVTDALSSLTTNGIFIGLNNSAGSVSVLAGATLISETMTVPTSRLGYSTIAADGAGLVSGTDSLWSSESFFQVDGSLTVADGGEVSVGADGLERVTLSPTVASGVINIGAAPSDAAVAPGFLDVALVTSTLSGTLNFNHTSTNYTFSPVIAGLTTVYAWGGTTILSGANTYTGGTAIGAGTIQVGNDSALSTGSVDMFDADARLIINGHEVGIAGLDGVAGSEVDLGSSGSSVLGLTNASAGASYEFSGNIVGGVSPIAAALVKLGASTQILSGDNTFMGAVNVMDGVLVLASNTALSSNAFVAVGADGQLMVNDGVDVTIAELFDSGPSGDVLLDGTSSLTVALDGATNEFGGVISGTGALGVDGNGLIQTLTGINTYTGGTSIIKGTLALTGAGALAATGALALTSSTAVFDMSGVTGDRTIGDLSGVTGSSVVLGAQGLTVGTANDTSFAGIISGVGGTLTKAGTGMLALGGVNTFTGLTTLSGGTLQVNGSLAGALTAQTGTTLQGTGSIGGVVTMNDGSTLAAGNSPGTLTVGSLVLSAGTSLDFELGDADVPGGGGPTNDLVIVNDDLTLAGQLNVIDSGTFALGTYTLFTYGGALTQNPLTFGSAPIGYNAGNFSLDTSTAGEVNLIVAAAATDQYWIGGTGTWNAGNVNWTDESGGIAATWGGQTGIFRGIAGTVTVDGAQSFNALRFESDGYVLQGDALAIAGVQGDVRVDTSFTATIGNVISGTGMLAKGGAGTLVLTGANTYSGGTLIAGGVLAISEDANLGDASGGVTLDGGTLQLAGSANITATRAFTVGGSGGGIDTGSFDLAITQISGLGTLAKSGAGTLDINGTGNLNGGVALLDGALDIHLGAGATFAGNIDGALGTEVGLLANGSDGVYAGVISGSTGIYVGGAGTIALSGVNTFTDYTIVDTGATLALTGAGSIAASDHLDLYGTLDISGTSNGASIQSLGFDGSVLLGAQTLTLTNAAGLFEGTISGTGGVTLLAGVQGFGGTSTYSGATNVAGDAFFIAITPNALSAASAFTVDGILGVGADQTIGSLAGSGFVGLNDPSGLDPVELTLGGNGTSTVFSGALVGEGTLIKTGAGTFTLTGDLSEFEGGMAVNGGILAINTVFTGGVDVLAGGALGGGGTIGSLTAASGGIIAPGNSIGTLSVSGDATFSAGSTYQVEIDPTGASDLLAVGGIATLGGATVDVLKAAGGYTAGARYTILTAAGGVSGTFGTLSQNPRPCARL